MEVAPPSTHVDEEGDVIAVYDDGDDGVYVNSNRNYQITNRSTKKLTMRTQEAQGKISVR